MPTSVWLSGFFNPQSFLTAIMQSTARKNELPLDKVQSINTRYGLYRKTQNESSSSEFLPAVHSLKIRSLAVQLMKIASK